MFLRGAPAAEPAGRPAIFIAAAAGACSRRIRKASNYGNAISVTLVDAALLGAAANRNRTAARSAGGLEKSELSQNRDEFGAFTVEIGV